MSGQKSSFVLNDHLDSSSPSDMELWERIQKQDTGAFSIIFKRYYLRLYRFTFRFVRDSQTAENVVQDMFVNLWLNRAKHNIRSNLKAYLFMAVRNRALNQIKYHGINKNIELDAARDQVLFDTPEQHCLDNEMIRHFDDAVNRLPDKCRQIYIMKRYDELKYTEIAAILGISVNTVKTQIRRALMLLQKHLAHLLNPLLA